jgi:thymidylate kinase
MVLDWIMGYWLQIRKWRSQGYLVISDRHSLLDMLVDPLRYRYGGPHRLVELVLPLTPRPDLILLLDAPEEILEARKSELTKEQIKELREGYLQLSRSLPNFRVIEASHSIEEVYADVVDAILALRSPERQRIKNNLL